MLVLGDLLHNSVIKLLLLLLLLSLDTRWNPILFQAPMLRICIEF